MIDLKSTTSRICLRPKLPSHFRSHHCRGFIGVSAHYGFAHILSLLVYTIVIWSYDAIALYTSTLVTHDRYLLFITFPHLLLHQCNDDNLTKSNANLTCFLGQKRLDVSHINPSWLKRLCCTSQICACPFRCRHSPPYASHRGYCIRAQAFLWYIMVYPRHFEAKSSLW